MDVRMDIHTFPYSISDTGNPMVYIIGEATAETDIHTMMAYGINNHRVLLCHHIILNTLTITGGEESQNKTD